MNTESIPLPAAWRRRFSFHSVRRRALPLLALAAAGFFLLQYAQSISGQIVPLEKIVVQGGDLESRTQTENRLASLRGSSLLHINLESYKTILEVLPGVDAVRLQRVLPHTLLVLLTASKPLARWNGVVIDSSGKIYPSETEQTLPVFRTDSRHLGKVATFYQEAARVLPADFIVQVDFEEYIGWRVFLANGVMLQLGGEPLPQLSRYAASMDALAQALPPLQSVDMRYDRGFAVRLHSEGQ